MTSPPAREAIAGRIALDFDETGECLVIWHDIVQGRLVKLPISTDFQAMLAP